MAAGGGNPGNVTQLLRRWSGGNREVLEELAPLVYNELRSLAASRLALERDGHTLQPTALIHEAYLRLVQLDSTDWHSRSHFFAVACRLMRQILVDHARRYRAAKRGGGHRVTLNEAISFASERGGMLLDLDEGLRELESFDERKAKLIELKYFGGLSSEEISQAMGISVSTIMRESRLAEAWLHNYLGQGAAQ
ncbi:MAG: sigma-70 family RNA polymerase sigma factor [Bryobacterales bacterium]|nr:sigma-70 family RNA polymerase sigma factor [Bryobacterales bacterium]